MSEQELLQELQELSQQLVELHGYQPDAVLGILTDDKSIPATVFSTSMSPLQAVVTYLHDHDREAFTSIAQELKRSYRAVWGAYQHNGITITTTKYAVPLTAIDDKHSILECVVKHLKHHYDLKFTQIARLLKKDPRTVWTVWNRAQKKDAQNR